MPGLLKRFGQLLKRGESDELDLVVDGHSIPVRIKRNNRARRLILRLAGKGHQFELTLPPQTSLARARSFLETSRDWAAQQLHRRLHRPLLAGQGAVLFRGNSYHIRQTEGLRGVIRIDEGARTLTIPGEASHQMRRLRDWMKAQARRELTAASRRYAAAMQTSIGRISIRDQKSRWGSCSAAGDLSYSWRLIMAPDFVLDYVAAHEVAHRVFMNHGPQFWRLVMKHAPHAKKAKHWLKTYGTELQHHL